MVLVASLLGTTFSVAAALYQGNLAGNDAEEGLKRQKYLRRFPILRKESQ
jgi:hypothetical protein